MSSSPPFLVLTAILDTSARAAALTRSHADALDRALGAIGSHPIDGIDVVELPIQPQAFAALRKQLDRDDSVVALYDLFPLSAAIGADVRKAAGQFLAAEILWTLEEQGVLSKVPMNLRIDVPQGWDRTPKEIHTRLVQSGALELSPEGIQTFKQIKTAWDRSAS